jgi:hypothetical protein
MVVLNQEQAKALEYVRTVSKMSKVNLVQKVSRGKKFKQKQTEAINTIPLEDLIHALYVGYEVYTTPEERLTELYYSYSKYCGTVRTTVMKEVLDILDVKIDGINA